MASSGRVSRSPRTGTFLRTLPPLRRSPPPEKSRLGFASGVTLAGGRPFRNRNRRKGIPVIYFDIGMFTSNAREGRTMKVYVVFYSMYGHVYRMAEGIAGGGKERKGAEVFLRRGAGEAPRGGL